MLRRLASLAIVAAFAVAALAAPVHAQTQLVRFADIESIGGFTVYNQKATFWASVTAGRITKGYALVERKYHRGQNVTIQMTGDMTAQETFALWNGVFQARPWTHAEVVARFVNTDLPDTKVTYLNRYTQLIRAGMVTPPAGMPTVSRAMETFMQAAWDKVQVVADGNAFVYEAAGGRLGYRRQITVDQEGNLTDEVSYTNPSAPGTPYARTGLVPPADLNNFKRLVAAAGWATLRDFAGQPSQVDGIDEQGSYYMWGAKKTVKGGYAYNRTRAYQAVLDEITRLADTYAP